MSDILHITRFFRVLHTKKPRIFGAMFVFILTNIPLLKQRGPFCLSAVIQMPTSSARRAKWRTRLGSHA